MATRRGGNAGDAVRGVIETYAVLFVSEGGAEPVWVGVGEASEAVSAGGARWRRTTRTATRAQWCRAGPPPVHLSPPTAQRVTRYCPIHKAVDRQLSTETWTSERVPLALGVALRMRSPEGGAGRRPEGGTESQRLGRGGAGRGGSGGPRVERARCSALLRGYSALNCFSKYFELAK